MRDWKAEIKAKREELDKQMRITADLRRELLHLINEADAETERRQKWACAMGS